MLVLCCERGERRRWRERSEQKEKQRVDRARPSFAVLCRPMASQMRRSAIDNHVIGVVALACVRAEASSLARFCWQRVEQRERRANEIIYFLFVFVMWWRAVDGVCALLGAVCAARCCVRGWVLCARLDAVCARHCVCDSRFAQYFFCITQRDTDVVFLSHGRLLARRCYGSSDEPGRRCCVEPNVD